MLEKGFDRASALFQVQGRAAHSTRGAPRPKSFAIRRNHQIEKKSFRFKELEHVRIEKAGQLFRNMLWDGQGLDSTKLSRKGTSAVIFRKFGGR
jgi:hypothetical protein